MTGIYFIAEIDVLDDLLIDAQDFDLEVAQFFLLRAETLGDCVRRNSGIFLNASANLLLQDLPVAFRHHFEMLIFTVEMQEVEVKEIVRLCNLADHDVFADVNVSG